MQNLKFLETIKLSDDAYISDPDYFIKTLSQIVSQPDLPEGDLTSFENSAHESATASYMKKRLFVESLVKNFPREKNSIPCNFLLRVLRVANMVGAGPSYRTELENRISSQLDKAELEELMIPCFGHTCKTLLDFELVFRLVKGFVSCEDGDARSGAGLVKVAKLVDSYLAEAGLDSHLGVSEFVGLASVVPSHARAVDDGLYRAVDTYLKAHPSLSKQDRKQLFKLIDSRKLSAEASIHAAQNERLPVRAVIQVLLTEQNRLGKHVIDWSGYLNGPRSPATGLDGPIRCLSKREMIGPQHMEIRRLKEDVLRLQSQCMKMEKEIEKLLEKKKWFFGWKKLWN